MKKILTTVAGLITFALAGAACSPAVDTKEATSTTPITASTVPVQRVDDIRKQVEEFKKSRSAVRPTATPKPGPSLHELHVKHVAIAKQEKAKLKPVVKKKPVKVKKTVKPKKVVHKKKKTVKAHKVVKKDTHKTRKKVSMSGIASCIAKYESGGNPRAQNPVSSASGLFQFVDGTWRAVTGRHDRAKDAPVSVQIAAFYKLWNGGRGAGHWVTAHKCGY